MRSRDCDGHSLAARGNAKFDRMLSLSESALNECAQAHEFEFHRLARDSSWISAFCSLLRLCVPTRTKFVPCLGAPTRPLAGKRTKARCPRPRPLSKVGAKGHACLFCRWGCALTLELGGQFSEVKFNAIARKGSQNNRFPIANASDCMLNTCNSVLQSTFEQPK